MVIRNPPFGALRYRLLNALASSRQCVRYLHKNVSPHAVPPPTPFVPDTQTFLTLIGRDMLKYASKLSSWEELFTISSERLRSLGIESARERRYLLRWREKFRRKEYGVGGDLDHVFGGIAELRVVEIQKEMVQAKTSAGGEYSDSIKQRQDLISPPLSSTATLSRGMSWAVVNLPQGETQLKQVSLPLKKYSQIRLFHGNMIKGPYLQAMKGQNGMAAYLKVQEGMWEHRLGRKIDGGERRRAEVRAKKRSGNQTKSKD